MYNTANNSTAGFTIFPHIVAIENTDPYVDLYNYYRRQTLVEVPRHSPFPLHFFVNRSFTIFMNIDPMGVVGRRSFRGNALVAHTMGDSPPAQFDQTYPGGGDEKYSHHGATAMASTVANAWKMPVL